MISKRTKRLITRIVSYPQLILSRLNGVAFNQGFSCCIVKDLLNESPNTIIDVGANKGEFINACKYFFPKSKIIAFEPQKEFANLLKNILGVTVFNFGLWDREGKSKFYKNEINTGASSFLKPTKNYDNYIGKIKNLTELNLLKKRFDNLDVQIKRPCFLKIDVEGAEEKVLRGFGDRLKEIDILQIEWFFKNLHENQMKLGNLMPLLEKYGFSGFVQIELVHKRNLPYLCDLIFFKDNSN